MTRRVCGLTNFENWFASTHLSGGLRLRNHRSAAGNHKFSSRFSFFACFF